MRADAQNPGEANEIGHPALHLFAGSKGAGKTTFARAYPRQLDPIPRFLNADEIARGLSPLDPQKPRLQVRRGGLSKVLVKSPDIIRRRPGLRLCSNQLSERRHREDGRARWVEVGRSEDRSIERVVRPSDLQLPSRRFNAVVDARHFNLHGGCTFSHALR